MLEDCRWSLIHGGDALIVPEAAPIIVGRRALGPIIPSVSVRMIAQGRAIFFASPLRVVAPLVQTIGQENLIARFDIGLIKAPRPRLALGEQAAKFMIAGCKQIKLVSALIIKFELTHVTGFARRDWHVLRRGDPRRQTAAYCDRKKGDGAKF
ncbi:MAG: hypothetical protein AAFO74_01830 [Pseudomonadota bacterium]